MSTQTTTIARLGRRGPAALGVALLAIALVVPEAGAATAKTKLVSVRSNGAQANEHSLRPAASYDGRLVAFHSPATNLVEGDTNGQIDVFTHDRRNGRTRRVSVRSNGAQGDGGSSNGTIGAKGRLVGFFSSATNLVANDTNGFDDVFVHDRRTGKTRRVSVRSNGAQGNGHSFDPAFSAGGRFVAFVSNAANLVGNDTNATDDVFVHDRRTGKTRRVSLRSNGVQGDGPSFDPAMSADGRYVTFHSAATNLVGNDSNERLDVFVHDRRTGKTRRVSLRSNGVQGGGDSFNPAISADGRSVAFRSEAADLVGNDTNGQSDIFINDRRTGRTRRVSLRSDGAQGDGPSTNPAITADGRFVVFVSTATNLVVGDTNAEPDIFVHDRRTGRTRRVSLHSSGAQGDDGSLGPTISADGRFVAFFSDATNLVANDTNAHGDVFVRGPLR